MRNSLLRFTCAFGNYHFTHGAWKCCAYSSYARFYQMMSHAFRLYNNAHDALARSLSVHFSNTHLFSKQWSDAPFLLLCIKIHGNIESPSLSPVCQCVRVTDKTDYMIYFTHCSSFFSLCPRTVDEDNDGEALDKSTEKSSSSAWIDPKTLNLSCVYPKTFWRGTLSHLATRTPHILFSIFLTPLSRVYRLTVQWTEAAVRKSGPGARRNTVFSKLFRDMCNDRVRAH